jgi:hypothetical protein
MSKPIYLSRPAIEKLFKLISEQKPLSITYNFLTTNGFGNSDAHTAIAGLNFLGFLNKNKELTDQFKKYLKFHGIVKQERLKTILKKIYNRLFQNINKPYLYSDDKLTKEFVRIYNLKYRLARSAALAFKWFCVKAGFITENSIKPPRLNSSKISTKINFNKKDSSNERRVETATSLELQITGDYIKVFYHNERQFEKILKVLRQGNFH